MKTLVNVNRLKPIYVPFLKLVNYIFNKISSRVKSLICAWNC